MRSSPPCNAKGGDSGGSDFGLACVVESVALEDLAYDEQLLLFNATDVLMGVEGQGIYSALLFLPPGATLALVVPPGHLASATQAVNIARVLDLNAVTSLPEEVERRHLGVTHGNLYWEQGNDEIIFTPDEASRLLVRAAETAVPVECR